MSEEIANEDSHSELEGPVLQPLVSVIIPSFNHAAFVEQAIESVWLQSYPNIELVVIDDASTDGTAGIVADLAERSPIPMRILLKPRNKGISSSLNIGLSMAHGSWISFLSSDDFFVESKTARQMEAARSLQVEFGCIHCDGNSVDSQGKFSGRNFRGRGIKPLNGFAFDDLIFNRARLIATSSVIRKDLIDKIGGFDEELVAEDYDFYLRLSRVTKFFYIDEALVNVRVSSSSLGRQPWRWVDTVFTAIDKHADLPGYDWRLIKAQRWLMLLPGFLENGNWTHVTSALSSSFKAAWRSRIIGKYLYHVGRAVVRAVGFRLKRKLISFRRGK